MPITESSVTLNFPDNNYLGYVIVMVTKQFRIILPKWMFVGMIRRRINYTYEQIKVMKEGISNYRIRNLVKKSVDTSCMFMSILLGKTHGNKIQQCSPFTISKNTKIILLSIINWTETDSTYISMMNTQYKSKFNSYAKLFDIKTFMVLTKDKASKLFTWIS